MKTQAYKEAKITGGPRKFANQSYPLLPVKK